MIPHAIPSGVSGPSHNSTAGSSIRVRGARTHNLQNVDVDIPRGRLVVVTGVSGSGKSSLAFDTLFAEGQRRFLETLSPSTRQFLDRMARPDVDDLSGLPPTLAVEQRGGTVQPRSTLATLTQIHDYLRLLFARAGVLHCPHCGRPVSQQSPQAIVEGILSLEAGRKVMILAPLVSGRKGKHRELLEKVGRDGFVRVRVDGTIYDAAAPPDLNKARPHTVEAVVDRIIVKEGLRARLQESVELAVRHGEGKCLVSHEEAGVWHDRLYSTRFACPDCELSFPDIEPRIFSFNNPLGACPTCEGLGVVDPFSREARPSAVARQGSGVRSQESEQTHDSTSVVCPDCNGARLGPVGRSVRVGRWTLPEYLALTIADAVEPAREFLNAAPSSGAELAAQRLIPELIRRLDHLQQLGLEYLSLERPVMTLSGGEYQRARLTACLGLGLRNVCYILDEPTIGLHPRDSQRLLAVLCELRDQGNTVVVVEHDLDIIRQADWLIDLGPGAGREGGRVIATGTPPDVANDPASVTGRYLHRSDSRALSDVVARWRDSGASQNPVLPSPFAGEGSGMGGRATQDPARSRNSPTPSTWLTLTGATARNLRDITARFPQQALTCVTGVSGSGKSSLVLETLVPLVRSELAGREYPVASDSRTKAATSNRGPATASGRPTISGIDTIARLIEIDQAPLGRNARSNPATASGVWDAVRRVFARTRDARVRGFRAARFSFNAAGGRCAECHGRGTRRVGMHFLPDVEIVCPVCRGARFNRQTLEVKFRGRSVADVLAMRIDEAAEFFVNFADVRHTLETFRQVGLGYLTLGQSAATLSGGEAQRIKLATELSRQAHGATLYLLDEPTTGLHAADVERLLHLLRSLVSQGHTVIVIEHNLEMIAAADWVIDLGPEGGAAGGQIIAEGPPRDVAAADTHTGRALRTSFNPEPAATA